MTQQVEDPTSHTVNLPSQNHNLIENEIIKMFQLIAILATFACAAAFSASSSRSARSALKMGFESEIGAQAPLGTNRN